MGLLHEYVQLALHEARKKYRYKIAGKSGWVQWPEEALAIPYAGRTGVGPGEDRLAFVLDGEVQGGSVSFDILDKDGNKWEVKEPSGSSGTIRPGTEGRAAIVSTRQQLDRACRKMRQGLAKVDKSLDITEILSEDGIAMIRKFLEKDVDMIKKGEISKGRMERFYQVIRLIHHIVEDETGEDEQKYVEMGDEEHTIEKNIDLRTYIRLGHFLNLTKSDLKVEDSELFAAAFNYEPFLDPEGFMDRVWNNAAKASEVFGHTSGIILVHPDGYKIIPRDKLDEELKFCVISQAVPKFKIADRTGGSDCPKD